MAFSRYESFKKLVDAIFSSLGGDVAGLGYRSRVILDIADEPLEKVAAVQIAQGAAETAIISMIGNTSHIIQEVRSAAQMTIAAIYRILQKKSDGRTNRSTAEGEIDAAKRKLLTRFAREYEERVDER